MLSKIKQLLMDQFKVCPKTGKIVGLNISKRKSFLIWIAIGLASLIWYLIRVVPKPSRASYPCQQVAQPLAAGFIAWLIGLIGSTLLMQRTGQMLRQKKYMLGAIFFAAAIMFSSVTFMSDTQAGATSTEIFTPTDPANTPVGIAKGINPGRVVWVYDSLVCDQNSTSGWWWEDDRTDLPTAQKMMKSAVTNLTGINDPTEAWDALFKHFNKERYNEDNRGYQAGDKIAIKVNNIFSRVYEWTDSQDNRHSPQMIYALIWQLVNEAGVPEEDITFYDCIFYHGDPIYQYCYKDFPGVRWAEGDATDRDDGHGYEDGPGDNPGTREKVVPDPECLVYYSDTTLVSASSGKVSLPTVVSEAKYIISFCLPRAHELAGITTCAKNFFGSVYHPDPPGENAYYYHGWCPYYMHYGVASLTLGPWTELPMGSYNVLVDLMGHKDLGGKTFLLLGERLRDVRWSGEPFNGGPASSIFMSQDFVAMESVLLDFLRNSDWGVPDGTPDNYLHEAAQAGDPPSGTVYDPENDGIPLESLGVHEHWNNYTDKQYSRNLGTGDGIELIQVINQKVTDVKSSDANIPNGFNLYQNYPNPFNPTTTISYSILKVSDVSIAIYDLMGREIKSFEFQGLSTGLHSVVWNGTNMNGMEVASGIYLYKLKAVSLSGDRMVFEQTKKLNLLK